MLGGPGGDLGENSEILGGIWGENSGILGGFGGEPRVHGGKNGAKMGILGKFGNFGGPGGDLGAFGDPQTLGGLHFAHVRHGGLFFGATTEGDASPFTLIEFLNRLVTLLRDFCGPLSEKSLAMNLALVGELLEELVDFGHIQTTSPEILRSLVQSEPESPKPFSLLDLGSVGLFGAETQQSRVAPGGAATRPLPPPRGDQGGVPDAEKIPEIPDFLGQGTPLKVDVQGEIRLKDFWGDLGFLGTPGSPTPPDLPEFPDFPPEFREFPQMTLMQYQVQDEIPAPLPFRLFPTVEEEPGGRIRIYLKLRCDLPPKSHAINVRLQLPVPKGVSSLWQELSSPEQSAELDLPSRSIRWEIPKIQGGSQLSALFKLDPAPLSRCWRLELGPLGPAHGSFALPALSSSGLRLRFLRLRGAPGAAPAPRWVRYLTHSDSYVMRL
uniref:MHD domain-containing protein n=1 Tax=Cyanistes caeruleus TaxID=156563 RepID=A0A8C0U5X2_CYACU